MKPEWRSLVGNRQSSWGACQGKVRGINFITIAGCDLDSDSAAINSPARYEAILGAYAPFITFIGRVKKKNTEQLAIRRSYKVSDVIGLCQVRINEYRVRFAWSPRLCVHEGCANENLLCTVDVSPGKLEYNTSKIAKWR